MFDDPQIGSLLTSQLKVNSDLLLQLDSTMASIGSKPSDIGSKAQPKQPSKLLKSINSKFEKLSSALNQQKEKSEETDPILAHSSMVLDISKDINNTLIMLEQF